MKKEDLKNTKIWFGDDTALRDKIFKRLKELGADDDDAWKHSMDISVCNPITHYAVSGYLRLMSADYSFAEYIKLTEKSITPEELFCEESKPHKLAVEIGDQIEIIEVGGGLRGASSLIKGKVYTILDIKTLTSDTGSIDINAKLSDGCRIRLYSSNKSYDYEKYYKRVERPFISGKYYYHSFSGGLTSYIFKCNETRDRIRGSHVIKIHDKVYEEGYANSSGDCRDASLEEIEWLDRCIEVGKFVDKDIAMLNVREGDTIQILDQGFCLGLRQNYPMIGGEYKITNIIKEDYRIIARLNNNGPFIKLRNLNSIFKEEFKKYYKVIKNVDKWVPNEGDWFVVTKDSDGQHLMEGDVKQIHRLSTDPKSQYVYYTESHTIRKNRIRKALPSEIPSANTYKVVDFGDPENWRVGDVVECISDNGFHFKKGGNYRIDKINEKTITADFGYSWGKENFKFISRPFIKVGDEVILKDGIIEPVLMHKFTYMVSEVNGKGYIKVKGHYDWFFDTLFEYVGNPMEGYDISYTNTPVRTDSEGIKNIMDKSNPKNWVVGDKVQVQFGTANSTNLKWGGVYIIKEISEAYIRIKVEGCSQWFEANIFHYYTPAKVNARQGIVEINMPNTGVSNDKVLAFGESFHNKIMGFDGTDQIQTENRLDRVVQNLSDVKHKRVDLRPYQQEYIDDILKLNGPNKYIQIGGRGLVKSFILKQLINSQLNTNKNEHENKSAKVQGSNIKIGIGTPVRGVGLKGSGVKIRLGGNNSNNK